MPQTKKKQLPNLYDQLQPYQEEQPVAQPIPSPTLAPNPTPYKSFTPNQDLFDKITAYIPEPLKDTTQLQSALKPVVSGLSWVTDKLLRGQYASVKFFDSFRENTWESFSNAVVASSKEYVNPKDKKSFRDIISPEFAKENPISADVLGFMGDLILDPHTYLGVGILRRGISVGGKVLTGTGKDVLQSGLRVASEETRFVPLRKPKIDPIASIKKLEEAQATGKFSVNTAIIQKELVDIGYYDKLKDNAESINKFIKQNNVTLTRDEINLLSKEQTLRDLKTQYNEGLDLQFGENWAVFKPQGKAGARIYTTPEILKSLTGLAGKPTGASVDKIALQGMITKAHDKGLHDIADELSTALMSFGNRNTISVVTKTNLSQAIRTSYHEQFHTVAREIAGAYGNLLGKDVIKLPHWSKIENYFKKTNYAKTPQAFETEALAMIGSGDYKKFGLSKLEAQEWLGAYRNAVAGIKTGKSGGGVDLLRQFRFPSMSRWERNASATTTVNKNVLFTPKEVYETVEQRISRLAEFPKLTDTKGLHLTVGIPFGTQVPIPGTKEIFKYLGIDYVRQLVEYTGKKIGTTGFGNLVGRSFVKEFDPNSAVPREFWDAQHSLENIFDSAHIILERTTKQMARNLPKDRLDAIGKAMADIRDLTKKQEDLRGRVLTTTEASAIKQTGLLNAKLTPQEFAYVSQLYGGYNKMMLLEMRAKLLDDAITNYSPRNYDLIKDGKDFVYVMRHNTGPGTFLSSSQQTKYKTLAEAIADGKVPEMNAAVLYAQRMVKSREKLAVARFNETTRRVFGFEESTKSLSERQIATLPKVVQSNIVELGREIYPQQLDDNFKTFLNYLDTATRWWKFGAYALKPASGVRQSISNPIQAALFQGVKAFKAFNPLAAVDAGLMVLGQGQKTPTVLAPFFKNILNKYVSQSDVVFAERLALDKLTTASRLDNFTKDFSIETELGQKYDGEYLKNMFLERGVIKGFDQSGERISTKIERALLNNTDASSVVAKNLAKYWKWPQLVEDYGRAMVMSNALRMGHSEVEALKIVNKALFNYSRGLSWTEKNVFKRIIPFYTFQRFAVPLVFNTLATKPGNVITGDKLVRLMSNLMTNDELSPTEQELISPFIIEQPHIYTGFDAKDQKGYFNIFNNMTPLDALSILVHDKKDDIDWQRTMQKTVLAQMTPFIKIPLELIEKKNFFTGQVLQKAQKLGDTNETLSMVIPQQIKDLMGWEDRNGKTYINTYLAHVSLGIFPAMKSIVIDPILSDESNLTKSMEFILGIRKYGVDFKEQQQYKGLATKKEIKDMRAKLFSAKFRNSESEYRQAEKELIEFGEAMKQNQIFKNQVRGLGIQNTNTLPDVPPEPEL